MPIVRLETIGILIDWLEDDYQNQLLGGAADAARRSGIRLVTFVGGALEGTERLRFGKHRNFIYDLANPASVDALLISAGTLVNAVGCERLSVWSQRYQPLPMCTVSVPLPGMPCVRGDNAAGIRQAITRLIKQRGLSRLVCLRGPSENSEADARYAVYCEVLAEHGLRLDPELVIIGDFIHRTARNAVSKLLDAKVSFQAIIAGNDHMALGAMEELQARGLRVPEDVAVVGFDDTADGRFAPVALSTVRQPIHGLGRAAIELLVRRIRGQSVPDETLLPTDFVARASCGLGHITDVASSIRPASTVAETLSQRREPLLRQLSGCTAEAAALLDAFTLALSEKSTEVLSREIRAVAARAIIAGEDSGSWRTALMTLAVELSAITSKHPELRLLQPAHLLDLRLAVTELGERVQARTVLAWQQHLVVLRRIGEGLLTSMDTESIMRLLAREVTDLGIPSCHIALFERERELGTAELVLSSEEGVTEAEFSPRRFAALDLMPGGTRVAARRTDLIVEPLYFEREPLGFAVFGAGPREGAVYEALREQISSALKRAQLVAELLQQTTLRQKAEREQVRKELEIATSIQTSILPRDVRVPGLEFAAHMRPMSEVGGDYYDVIACEDGCWLGIGDVAGHGLQAGLVMLMIQSMLGALVLRNSEQRPSAMLRVVNGALFANVRDRLQQDEHATLTILHYHREGRLEFAGAHEEILVYRSATRRVEQICTPGPWIGIMPELGEVEDTEIQLEDRDVIVLYTDGVTEARNANKELFGQERLVQLVGDSGEDSVESIRDRVLHAVLSWAPVPEDDVTLLIARYRAPS